ncbi:hypothetical protein [Paenibacillus sp. RC84]|uniref:hypothetical protein n=1 Tax=Paenibacillus sp. RC84 TaxID=3156252 RepID=UPI0035198E47
MKRGTKVVILASLTMSLIGAATISTNSFALNETVTAPRKMSKEEINATKQLTGVINNEFGKFVKVSSPKDLPDAETANSVENVNAKTKQIIDPEYGIFLKE